MHELLLPHRHYVRREDGHLLPPSPPVLAYERGLRGVVVFREAEARVEAAEGG